jgi:hypothetical protein
MDEVWEDGRTQQTYLAQLRGRLDVFLQSLERSIVVLEVCTVESATATLEIRHRGAWNVGLRCEIQAEVIRH